MSEILFPMKDHVLSFVTVLQDLEGGKKTGWETGSFWFDRYSGGLRPGQFVVIGARPSVGKTAYALWMARCFAKTGIPVGFVSLEMLSFEVMARLTAMESGVDTRIISAGTWSAKQKTLIAQGTSEVAKLSLFLSDDPKINLVKLRQGVRESGVRILILDYIQLMRLGGFASRHEEVEGISRELKLLAQEEGICMVGLSQLVRDAEGHKPSLASLRQSGALEQDADLVILLHGERTSKAREIIFAKNRAGPVGSVHFEFRPETNLFFEKQREPEAAA